MRITTLSIKRPLLNRISYWLYDKFCREPYFPQGKVKANIMIRPVKHLAKGENPYTLRIDWIPDRFVPGVHGTYLNDIEVIDFNKQTIV